MQLLDLERWEKSTTWELGRAVENRGNGDKIHVASHGNRQSLEFDSVEGCANQGLSKVYDQHTK